MEELKLCPFCGNRAYLFTTDELGDTEKGRYTVKCGSCFCGTGQYTDQGRAKEAWNRRAAIMHSTTHKTVVLNLFDSPTEDEKDIAEVGEYVYARGEAEEFGFIKNNLYEIIDTNGLDTISVKNEKGKKVDMSVEYFSSYCTLN